MDTYALGQLCEALGMRLPMVLAPMVNDQLWQHPAWALSLTALRSVGVRLVDVQTGRLGAAPVTSGTGATVVERFDPAWLVSHLDAAAS